MRRFAVAGSAVLLLACHTITEELPARPSRVVSNPNPVVVVPISLPSPSTPGPTPAPANPTPAPAPTTNPGPAPTPNPAPNPNPGGQIPNNTSPVARLGAKVFFVECNGEQVPGTEYATEADVNCRIHFDVTPKDEKNQPTQTRETPDWTFSGVSMKVKNGTGFNPVVTPQSRGTLSGFCRADGVTSNTVTVQIK